MKIIHLSDPHISPDKLFEHDAKERFSLALQHICNNHLDSKLFVISGDLTHDGDSESYNKLNEIKKKSMQKWKDGANRGTDVHNWIQDYAGAIERPYSNDDSIAKLQKSAKD